MASSSAASAAAGGGSASTSSHAGSAAGSTVAAASSPCAGCKFLRRKCQPDCVFAPYFPPDNPHRFAHVHRVFGASNVTKLLLELHPLQREDAVNSLAYEAEMRMRDPVYGCVGVISILQHQLRQLQADLAAARAELARYQSAAAGGGNGMVGVGQAGGLGFGRELFGLPGRDHHHHHHSHQMAMVHGYDGDLAARLGVGGVYDVGLVAGIGASPANLTQFGGQFLKPSAAGGDERQGMRPS